MNSHDNLPKVALNPSRYDHFLAIWHTANGSDFTKALAMLRDYVRWLTWGTHGKAVGEVLEAYDKKNGYLANRIKTDSILFTLPMLLFSLSEKINFSALKP